MQLHKRDKVVSKRPRIKKTNVVRALRGGMNIHHYLWLFHFVEHASIVNSASAFCFDSRPSTDSFGKASIWILQIISHQFNLTWHRSLISVTRFSVVEISYSVTLFLEWDEESKF